MINVGSMVTIKPSAELYLFKLKKLVGREAEVLEIFTSIGRLNKGYLIKLTEPYLGEEEWFIPIESIEDDE